VRDWPVALSSLIADLDEPLPKSKSDSELALSALGAILSYLQRCLVDVDLVTMRKFEVYLPATILQNLSVSFKNENQFESNLHMLGFADC
jgi:hypothetical protein